MEYWAKRNLNAQRKLSELNIQKTEKLLAKYYLDAQKKIIGQFEITYNKVLSMISEGKQPTPADLYKLDSYWKGQNQLKDELLKLGNMQAQLLSKQFVNQYLSIYESIAIPGVEAFSTVDAAAAQQIINHIWCADGKVWSQRIWENTELLAQTLNDELVHCVVSGKKTTELTHLLQERFNVSYNRADALVRTEMAHLQTQATKQRYTDYGIEEVEIWADKDERRCEVCGQLHQKRFPVGAEVPIPAHPRCRCCLVPVVD